MTDIAPTIDAAPAAAAPADVTPTAEPTSATDVATPEGFIPKAVYDREVANQVRERNLWKPIKQAFDGLDEGSRASLLDLAERARSGDADAIIEWAAGTIENVSGKSAADAIAERVLRGTPGQPTTPEAPKVDGLSRDDVAKLVASTIAERDLKAELTGVLTSAGYDLNSPSGIAIVQIAKTIPGTSPREALELAIQQYDADVIATAQRRTAAAAAAAAAVAGEMPQPAPNGAAVAASPAAQMTPRERVLARTNALRRGGEV